MFSWSIGQHKANIAAYAVVDLGWCTNRLDLHCGLLET